jgi:hypothetical protein
MSQFGGHFNLCKFHLKQYEMKIENQNGSPQPFQTLKIHYQQFWGKSFKGLVSGLQFGGHFLFMQIKSLKKSEIKKMTPEMDSTPSKPLKMMYYNKF